MSMRSKLHLLILCIFLSILRSQSVAENHTWVGSKYQIECTMCASCDNPCNTPSPPPPQPLSPPPPPPPSSSNIYPPPPPPSSSGGNNYYYPPPSTSYYYAPPPPYRTYPTGPTPPPPNPIVPYFPFYFHTPPPSSSSLSKPLHNFTLFFILTTLFTFSSFL